MEQTPKSDTNQPRKTVKRYSPDRLLRQKVDLPGGVAVSAEKHRGRIVVRLDFPPLKDVD